MIKRCIYEYYPSQRLVDERNIGMNFALDRLVTRPKGVGAILKNMYAQGKVRSRYILNAPLLPADRKIRWKSSLWTTGQPLSCFEHVYYNSSSFELVRSRCNSFSKLLWISSNHEGWVVEQWVVTKEWVVPRAVWNTTSSGQYHEQWVIPRAAGSTTSNG